AGLIWFARQCDIKSLPELLTVKARPSRSKFLRLASKSSRDGGLSDRIKIFEQLVQSCPDGWLGWFKLGRLYRHNRQVEQSLDALYQVSRCQPGFTLAYFERARLYRHLKQPENAQQELLRLFQFTPDHEGGLKLCAELYLQQGNLSEAIEILSRLSTMTQNPDALLALQQEILSHCSQQAGGTISDKDPDILTIRADLLMAQADIQKALQTYYQALKLIKKPSESLQKKVLTALKRQAAILTTQQAPQRDIVALWSDACKHLPNNADLLVEWAKVAQDNNEDVSQLLPRLKAMAGIWDHPELYYQMGLIHEKQKDHSEALKAFGQCLNLQPKHANAAYRLGTLFGIQHQLDLAKQWLSRALENNPNLVDAWFNLAVAHEQQQAPKLAQAAYQRVLSLNPKHIEAINNLRLLSAEPRLE
ncbi:MAG: tetratricopeptide repeat protein, partial [Vampirovibrionales bacterium]|nr:tetratricopeptide repeat protein [Vampirovibrionales bacterium]